MCPKKNGNSKDSLIIDPASDKTQRHAEEYLQNIIEHAPSGILTLTIEGKILQANPAYCEITGYAKEELEGMNYKSLTLEEDIEIDHYNVQQLLEGRVNSYKLEKRYTRKDKKLSGYKSHVHLLERLLRINPFILLHK